MRQYISEILKRKDLLIYLIQSGLKADHRNSYLGYFWWLLDPLLNVLVYYFLVVIILNRGGENYAVYLVIGLVAWRWMSTTINNSARAIIKYSSIINQVYLPKSIFPLTMTFTQLVNFVFGLMIIAIFLIVFGIVPGWQIVFLPLIIVIQLIFLLSISLLVAYICVFIRDVDHIIGHVVRILFYSSPIIWEGSRLPPKYSWVVDINPIAIIVDAYRDILMYGTMPQLTNLLIIAVTSLAVLALLLLYYSRNEHKIIKAL